jgi:hypothetical protein
MALWYGFIIYRFGIKVNIKNTLFILNFCVPNGIIEMEGGTPNGHNR